MELEPGNLDEIYESQDRSFGDAPEAEAEVETDLLADVTAETEPEAAAEVAPESETPEKAAEEVADPNAGITAQLTRLAELKVSPAQLAAMGTTPEEFLAEVDRQSAALAGETQAARAETELRDTLRPKAEELLAAVANGEMTQEVADRLFDAEWKAAQADQRIAQAEAKAQALEAAQAVAQRDAQVARIAAEFPGVPEADLRELAAEGVSLDKIRSLAGKMSNLLTSREQEATAKYAARKESDKKSHVPARGDGAKESVIPARESFDDIWS